MRLIMFFFFFLLVLGSTLAGSIDLKEYKQYAELLNKHKNKINFDKIKKFEDFHPRCDYYNVWNDYYILPWCFLKNKLPKLDFIETLNFIWPFIKDFTQVYNLNSTWFFYYPAKPKYFIKYDLSNVIWTGKVDNLLLRILVLTNIWIKVPKIYLAFNQIKNWSFYIVAKDLSKRNWWRLQNFNTAIKALNNYVLYPWEELFVNKILANLPGYYKDSWNKKYLFYWWVCGASTMVFRLALINPYLYVLKRYNHLYWYVNFYSSYLYGDDAALYEYQKVLKIKNIWITPIIFKFKKLNNKDNYFVSVVPKKVDRFVFVKRENIWRLKSLIKKIVFNQDWWILYTQKWISKYIWYSYER